MSTRNVRRSWRGAWIGAVAAGAALVSRPAPAQFPDVESQIECPGCGMTVPAFPALTPFLGTWSTPVTSQNDAEWTAEDFFCFTACTREGRGGVAALLHDPANARRSAVELFPIAAAANAADAATFLTRAAAASAASSSAVGTRFACSPDGLVPLVVSPLALAIEQEAGRVVLRYEELGARRSIRFGDHEQNAPLAAPLGTSVAHIENGALVVQTVGIAPGRILGSSRVDLQACKLEYSIVSPK